MSGRSYLRSRPALQQGLAREGFSETQLSRRAGFRPEQYRDLVTGRRACCSVEDAREIADALGCRFADLFATL